jgi:cephalosporin-C deacetylase-like acetyl esterase
MRVHSRYWSTALRVGAVLALAVLSAGAQDFTFDRQRPFSVADRDVSVREIAYAGPSGEATEATLVAPVAPGRHPAVLFVHWYGPEHTTSNRTQYVPDALALARHGFVSMLVDTPWSEPSWFPTREPANDVTFSTSQVKRLQRAVDVLASLDRVDAGRLALVGHDFGAMYGAVVAGLDRRITAFAFVAGTAKFADWFLFGRKLDADARARIYGELAPFDPVSHLPKLTAGAVLLQFATKDPYVTADAAKALIAAVKAPKRSKFYDCGHDMNREAMDDRVAWLIRSLGGPPKQAASR